MSEEDTFQAAIDANPLDKLPRLVFCDWLDERNDPRAEGYRVLAEFDRWPWFWSDGACLWFYSSFPGDQMNEEMKKANHGVDRSSLPRVWYDSILHTHRGSFLKRRGAFNAAATGWLNLSNAQRAACLKRLRRNLRRRMRTVRCPHPAEV